MGGSILSKIKRVEIFGPEGKIVTAQPKVVTVKPYSVAEIQPDDTERDDRIPKNLFNGRNNTWEAQDSWLAPLASSLKFGYECDIRGVR